MCYRNGRFCISSKKALPVKNLFWDLPPTVNRSHGSLIRDSLEMQLDMMETLTSNRYFTRHFNLIWHAQYTALGSVSGDNWRSLWKPFDLRPQTNRGLLINYPGSRMACVSSPTGSLKALKNFTKFNLNWTDKFVPHRPCFPPFFTVLVQPAAVC